MDLKERFIENTIVMMSTKMDKGALYDLRNCLITLLEDYDLIPHKELLSQEVVDNSYVLKHFLATKKISGLSINSLKTYTYHLNKFFRYCEKNVHDITTNDIRRYLGQLGMNNSNSYIDDARRVLNSFFTFCEDEEYVIKNPCKRIEKIKQKKVVRTPYSDTEIELLREACKTKREICLIDFLLSTGCRRDEIRQVKVSDINFNERSVLIHGKGSKDRVCFMSARCILHIKEYVNNRKCNSEYLFCSDRKPCSQMTNTGLACIVKRIGKRANVQNVHLHRFRRSFATYMINRGVPIQDLKEMLGHSKLDTTNIYVGMNQERIKTSYRNNCM